TVLTSRVVLIAINKLNSCVELVDCVFNKVCYSIWEVSKFYRTLTLHLSQVHLEAVPPPQIIPEPQGGKENQAFSIPGKHSLVMNLQKTVAKKGSPDVLAPGYSGPLKEIPHEKFNTTVIPKSYCSPWRQALGDNEELMNAINAQLPQLPQGLQPANYRCFNR
uniref:Myozenin 3a n=1 Tax=Amphiprion percula TaxID=161767 RepID=A0A3P8TDA7_AMPPE